MALEDYSRPRPTKWVNLGGKDKTGKTNPIEIKGYYMAKTTGPNRFDPSKMKTDFILKTASDITGVSGSGNMARVFAECEEEFFKKNKKMPLGAWVQIAFIGTVPTNKGNPMKTFKVLFDKDDMLEVAGLEAESTELSETEYDSTDTVSLNTDDEDDDAVQAAALERLERANRVKDMVKSKGKSTRT